MRFVNELKTAIQIFYTFAFQRLVDEIFQFEFFVCPLITSQFAS